MSSDIGHRIWEIRHQTEHIGYQTSDFGHTKSDIGHRLSDNGHQTSEYGRRTSNITITVHSPLFFRKIVEIERFALRASILDECQNYLGAGAV